MWLRRTCKHCSRAQTSPLKKKCPICKKSAPKISKQHSTCIQITDDKGTRPLLAEEALQWLNGIPKEDVEKIFPNRKDFHPKHLILTVLPIPPNCVRPSPTMDGDEVRGEDDITRRLLYVLRVGAGFRKIKEENSVIRGHAIQRFQDAVHMYIDQTRMHTKYKSGQKSISERLRGKQGRLRGTLMGKRCNFTARTVITGDAMLDMREVGVPRAVAETLTVVEHVNRLNFDIIKKQIANQDARIKYVIREDGSRVDLKRTRGQVDLKVGMSVERILRDGDLFYLIVNLPYIECPSCATEQKY